MFESEYSRQCCSSASWGGGWGGLRATCWRRAGRASPRASHPGLQQQCMERHNTGTGVCSCSVILIRNLTSTHLSTFRQTDLCWSRRSPGRWGRSRRCGCRARGGGGGWGGSAGPARPAPRPRARVSAPRHWPAAGGPGPSGAPTPPWSPGGAGQPHGHH